MQFSKRTQLLEIFLKITKLKRKIFYRRVTIEDGTIENISSDCYCYVDYTYVSKTYMYYVKAYKTRIS